MAGPDVGGDVDDEGQLGDLLVVGQHVALDRRGEAALGRQAQLLERHVLRRLVDASLERVLVLERARLGRDEAEHDHLARRHEAQRFEPARARVVVLQKEPVDVQLGEQRLGHEVVATLGRPRRAEVAPAHVRRDVHARRPVAQGGVDVADVGLVLVLRVAALRGDHRPLRGVVEVGEAGVVELQVGAAELAEAAYLLGVGVGQVGPERVEVGVDRRVDRGPAAAVVHHARRRDRQLRRLPGAGVVAQERERVARRSCRSA